MHISVTAVDQLPLTYFKSKLGAEQAVLASSVPSTVLRAAQFHDFAIKTVGAIAKLPVMPIPGGLRLQPVDARDVAERLVELALRLVNHARRRTTSPTAARAKASKGTPRPGTSSLPPISKGMTVSSAAVADGARDGIAI